MTDLHQARNAEIDAIGWLFSALVAAIIVGAGVIAYEAIDTRPSMTSHQRQGSGQVENIRLIYALGIVLPQQLRQLGDVCLPQHSRQIRNPEGHSLGVR